MRNRAVCGFLTALLCIAGAADAQVANGSFESAFTGWSTIGATSIETAAFGTGPTDGTNQALLTSGIGSVPVGNLETFLGLAPGSIATIIPNPTEGSAISTTVTASAGDILLFDWNFLTNEGTRAPSTTSRSS